MTESELLELLRPPEKKLEDALRRIAELEAALDDFLMHCVEGPTSDWMMIPRSEFDNIVKRGCLAPRVTNR